MGTSDNKLVAWLLFSSYIMHITFKFILYPLYFCVRTAIPDGFTSTKKFL
jgi:hypothetical protein